MNKKLIIDTDSLESLLNDYSHFLADKICEDNNPDKITDEDLKVYVDAFISKLKINEKDDKELKQHFMSQERNNEELRAIIRLAWTASQHFQEEAFPAIASTNVVLKEIAKELGMRLLDGCNCKDHYNFKAEEVFQ